MKKLNILLLMMSMVLPFCSFAQGGLTLTMNVAAVQPQFETESDSGQFVSTITGTSGIPVNFEFKVTIYGDGLLMGQSDLISVPQYNWLPGNVMINTPALDPGLSSMRSNFGYKESILTGVMPVHNYQMTISLVDPVTYMPLTDSQTINYTIQTYSPPNLIFPANADTLSYASFQVNFKWNSDTPGPSVPEYYRLTIAPIFAGQSAATALA